jgi:hypothetical protein
MHEMLYGTISQIRKRKKIISNFLPASNFSEISVVDPLFIFLIWGKQKMEGITDECQTENETSITPTL